MIQNRHINVLEKIDAIHKRLDKVMIDNLDFEALINQYDFKDAFFYCDPPYTTGYNYYKTSKKDFDNERLKELLGNIKGRFLLKRSENLRPLMKNIAGVFASSAEENFKSEG